MIGHVLICALQQHLPYPDPTIKHAVINQIPFIALCFSHNCSSLFRSSFQHLDRRKQVQTTRAQMASSACNFTLDNTFGPAVNTCRRKFDFTLYFEQLILTTIPATIFLAIFLPRLWYLHYQERKITKRSWANINSVSSSKCSKQTPSS